MTDEVAATAFPQHVNKNVDTQRAGWAVVTATAATSVVAFQSSQWAAVRSAGGQGFHARTPALM